MFAVVDLKTKRVLSLQTTGGTARKGQVLVAANKSVKPGWLWDGEKLYDSESKPKRASKKKRSKRT